MRTSLCLLTTLVLTAVPVSAQTADFRDPLLDRLVGEWVLEGPIAGTDVTHDVVAEWVLGHQYLKIRDVSREQDSMGRPEYEAIVLIGWDAAGERYACLWLDSTGGGGLAPPAMGYATANADTIPFAFPVPDGSAFHNTFSYDRSTDTWEWHMEVEAGGARQTFARVTLSRK
jgi:hypothetical protein